MNNFITELEALCEKYGVKLSSEVDPNDSDDKLLICYLYEIKSLLDTDPY